MENEYYNEAKDKENISKEERFEKENKRKQEDEYW